jgi:hypothetical protein
MEYMMYAGLGAIVLLMCVPQYIALRIRNTRAKPQDPQLGRKFIFSQFQHLAILMLLVGLTVSAYDFSVYFFEPLVEAQEEEKRAKEEAGSGAIIPMSSLLYSPPMIPAPVPAIPMPPNPEGIELAPPPKAIAEPEPIPIPAAVPVATPAPLVEEAVFLPPADPAMVAALKPKRIWWNGQQRIAAGLATSGLLHALMMAFILRFTTNAKHFRQVSRSFIGVRLQLAGLVLMTLSTLTILMLYQEGDTEYSNLAKVTGIVAVWGPAALIHAAWLYLYRNKEMSQPMAEVENG